MVTNTERKTAYAIAKYVRISPRKVRVVADEIRGKHVDEAFKLLAFTPRRAARFLWKVLESAVANAERNHQLNRKGLYVSEVRVDEGPTLKRWRPRAMGRATMVRKRSSHIYIAVEEKGANR